MKSHSIRRVLLASACSFVIATPAYAQDAEEGTEDDNVIIVTAQNREQNLNDVPIAIDVVSGEELKKAGFADMNSVDRIAPAVQLTQDQGTVKITLRGVGSQDNAETNDTSVVVNIDGEYINRPNVMSIAMFDIDRVEVLRGPQGTLYGRNSTGGAINFITRKPGNEFGVNASASYGNYNSVRVDAGVDLPLGDTAGVRIAAFYDEHDGYINHPARAAFGPFPAFAGGKSDDNQSYGGRVSVKLAPSEAVTINLAAEYAERHFTPGVFAYADFNAAGNGPGATCGDNGFERVAPAYSPPLCIPRNTNFLSRIDRSNFAAPNFGLGNVDQKTWAVRGRIAFELSDSATLTYIGGYRHYDETNFKPLPVVYRNFTHLDVADTHSHELRINGEFGGGVVYQFGGFYFNEKLDRAGGFFLPIGPNGSYLSYFRRDLKSDSWSAFGQVEVPLGETLTAVGGLRYTKNTRDAVYNNDGLGTLFNVGPIQPPASLLTAPDLLFGSKEDKLTWLAGLNYKPNPDTLVYAKATTGMKGGGFDAVGQYKPETNTAYELGWKQSFGESSQHQFNLTGFYYNYKDLQVSVLLDTTVGGQTFNAGKSTIYGIEADAKIKLSDNDTFTASVNYLNSKYDDLNALFNAYCVGCGLTSIGDLDPVAPGVQQPNFKGNTAAFSPEWVIALGYEHVFDLGGAGTLTASANTVFKSEYFTDFFNYRDSRQTAFTKTDLQLEYRPENDRFSVTAFVRNLEDTRALTYGSYIAAGPDDIYNWQFGAPRTYGVRVGVEF